MARPCLSSLQIFLFVLLLFCSRLAVSASNVKSLPGFQGPLPFQLETGYVGVGESEDVQLFYYFVKSENPEKDPLMLWLTGGPGCSVFTAFAYENGPLYFKEEEYNGSLPTLVLNPYSWTKVANIIFVDSPVGTGFSYARKPYASITGDFKQVHQLHQFLRKWLEGHSEFLSSPVYIGGDSYSGFIVPVVVQEISTGNEEGIEPQINLQGYILGNPTTDFDLDSNSRFQFCHGMGLISDELYESLKTSCRGNYQDIKSDNSDCLKYLEDFSKCTSGLNPENILEPLCNFASPRPVNIVGRRRYLHERLQEHLDPEPPLPAKGCRNYGHSLSYYWADNETVRKALHIRKGSIGKWLRCNYALPYISEIISSFQYHVNLSTRGYRVLVYSGDHDLIVPFMSTQAWIRALNYPIVEDWRPWTLQGQVAGYTRTYSNRMTFATVKGAGHTAPEYKPAECYAMFKRWIHGEPL